MILGNFYETYLHRITDEIMTATQHPFPAFAFIYHVMESYSLSVFSYNADEADKITQEDMREQLGYEM